MILWAITCLSQDERGSRILMEGGCMGRYSVSRTDVRSPFYVTILGPGFTAKKEEEVPRILEERKIGKRKEI